METTKRCIACAEEILADAQLCKVCKTRQDDPSFINKSAQTPNVEAPAVAPPASARTVCPKCKDDNWIARVADVMREDYSAKQAYNTASTYNVTTQQVEYTNYTTQVSAGNPHMQKLQGYLRYLMDPKCQMFERMERAGIDLKVAKSGRKKYRFLLYWLPLISLLFLHTLVIPLLAITLGVVFGLRLRKKNPLNQFKITDIDRSAALAVRNGRCCTRCMEII
jgi:hypothetical protein